MADKHEIKHNVCGNTNEVPGRSEGKLCQPCSKKGANDVADVFCEDCSEYQCNECSKVHQHFSIMTKHKLTLANEGRFKLPKYDMKGLDHCKEHQELLKFLCEDENKLCCTTCAIVKHRKCQSVVEVDKKAKVQLSILPTLQQELIRIESNIKAFRERLIKTEQKLTTDSHVVIDTIQHMQDKVNTMFEDLKRNISKDIDDFQQQARSEIYLRKTSVDNNIAGVQQSIADIESIMKQGTPAQQFVRSHHIREQINQLQENSQRNDVEFRDILITFQFDEFLKLPPVQDVIPGKLIMKYITAGEEPRDSKDKLQTEQTVNLKLLASIDLTQGKDDEEKPLYTGLDFLPDGTLVVVDNMNQKCIVYNQQLQQQGSFKLSSYPLDVVAVSNDEVAVTTGNALKVLMMKINNGKVTLNRTVKVNNRYDSICMMDGAKFIVGTIDDPQQIRVVSTYGEEKKLGINFPDKTYPSHHSACTYIKNCNKVVLTDRYVHTVYIYDISSNTRVEVKDEKSIKEPRCVAVGPGDRIFVCSKNTNSIVQLSHFGQVLSSHVLDMKYPYCLSVSEDNKLLAVSNNVQGIKKLQLYSICRYI